jgi:GLPGLI family protein
MILKAGIRNSIVLLLLLLFSDAVSAQFVSTGRIVYERKTNLKKRFGDNPRMKNFITEENKYRIENFELYFNDSTSVFRPIEEEEAVDGGWMKYLTTKNTVYQNRNSREKFIAMDLWGNSAYIKDSMDVRAWKITDSKREISGYNCRKAIWKMNDTTRIYAWYTVDIIPSTGPEGFEGLPGAILGLATEDGSVIYFAKEVQVVALPLGVLNYDEKGKDVYTEEALKSMLMERMGQWVKPKDLESMFSWL